MEAARIVAVGVAQANLAELAALRRQKPPLPQQASASLAIRHADEHTLIAMQAFQQALRSADWDLAALQEWGVLVSSRFPGRLGLASIFHRYEKLGPVGVSPMFVPTQALHAAAGTLSVVYALQGPNFGVGGGQDHVCEGLLAGMALDADNLAPGIWVILTASYPNLLPDTQGKISNDSILHGLALGFSSQVVAPSLLDLQLRRTSATPRSAGPADLLELIDFVNGTRRSWEYSLPGGGVLELNRAAAPALRKAS